MNLHELIKPIHVWFITRRLKQFVEMFPDIKNLSVLDVGGTPLNWDVVVGFLGAKPKKLVLANLKVKNSPDYKIIAGDARCMPFKDGEFDLVFSNSVIEHVGTPENQRKYASECLRIGKKIYIQTPKYFFIEPHIVTPFIHWLPRDWVGYYLIRYFTFRGWVSRPSRKQIEEKLPFIRLVSENELKEFFPGCEIITERFLFMPKSFMIIKR
jgi:SAM-dependent methyltransferase